MRISASSRHTLNHIGVFLGRLPPRNNRTIHRSGTLSGRGRMWVEAIVRRIENDPLMLKVELHAHTDMDPADRILHSTTALIDRAAGLGYGAIAVTLHDRYFDPAPWSAYAFDRGIVLLSGIEKTIEHRHILLINFPPSCASVRSFDEIRRLKAETAGLVVAPHPYYPLPSALRSRLDRHADLFDAVELNSMYTPRIDFNRRAITWARARGVPLVGNTDLHLLEQLGTTYSMVDAPAHADAICEAIRLGRVEVTTQPLTETRAALIFSRMCFGGLLGRTGFKGS